MEHRTSPVRFRPVRRAAGRRGFLASGLDESDEELHAMLREMRDKNAPYLFDTSILLALVRGGPLGQYVNHTFSLAEALNKRSSAL